MKDEVFGAWFDVRFKLPRKDGELVVLFDPTSNPTVVPAQWDDENEKFITSVDINPTHWLPLPQAPKSHAWSDGFAACEKDEAAGWPDEITHNPFEPTSPWCYPCKTHQGPPTLESSQWDAGYHYRQFEHNRPILRVVFRQVIGNRTIEMDL